MRGLVSLGVVAVLLGGCGSEERGPRGEARWSVADLDFGRVLLGADAARPLEIVNDGDGSLTLSLALEGADAAAFVLGGATLEVPAGGQGRVAIVFEPQRRGPHAAQVRLAPCAACEPTLVELQGEGGIVSVAAVPETITFPPVAPGSSASRLLELRNEGDFPVRIERASFARDDDFAVAATLPRLLEVDESIEVEVTFSPAADAALESRASELRVEMEGRASLVVPVAAPVGHLEVVAEPAFLDFGLQPTGVPASRRVVAQRVGRAGQLRIVRAEIHGSSDFSVSADPPLPAEVGGPGDLVSLEVRLFASSAGATAAELRLFTDSEEAPLITVPLRAEARESTCELQLASGLLRFGAVSAGAFASRSVEVVHAGPGDCFLDEVALAAAENTPFSLPELPTAPVHLHPGHRFRASVRFDAAAGSDGHRYEATLVLRHGARGLELPVSASITNHLFHAPGLRYGMGTVGDYQVKELVVTNGGDRPLPIVGATLARESSACYSLRPFVAEPVAPGAATSVRVEFLPRWSCGLYARGAVEIALEQVEEPIVVSIDGMVGALSVVRTEVTCPPHSTAVAGEPVRLEGEVVWVDDEPGSCSWQILEAPPGAEVALDGAACSVEFVPDQPGAYVLAFEGVPDWWWPLGATCTTTVHVAAAP